MQVRGEIRNANADIAKVIRDNTDRISEAVAQAFELMPKWQVEAQNYLGFRADFLRLQFRVFSEYAAEYFNRGDAAFQALFIGEIIKALYVPRASEQEAHDTMMSVLSALRDRLTNLLTQVLSPTRWSRFSKFLDEVVQTLTVKSDKVQQVLFVGDCLFLDLVPFIVAELLEARIRIVPDYATSKNPIELRDELRAFSSRKFDLVFFSPFSYEFSLEYNQLLNWDNALMGTAAASERAQAAWEQARGTIDVIADLFDCPVYVHNSAAVIREDSTTKRVAKALITARNRTHGRRSVNEKLASYIRQKNDQSYPHLFLFDEQRLVDAFGQIKAGAFLYKSALQHPAVLGRVLGHEYVDLIYVNTWLLRRKVVVCDLDNTLWKGIIGEAQVIHYHERQQALKALKEKGVVLAINSKNDPTNVHWRQGTLGEEDFVFSAISWEPKAHGMRRIQRALNLKEKDYVFVDDRQDERELMRVSYPEMLCLDGSDTRAWKRIALWAQALPQETNMDRTLMYKQREERKAFIQEDVSSPEERAQLFRSLDLRLTIERAQLDDLKRVAELINRTNQFNLEGSRTSFREINLWHRSPEHLILLGRTRDRFGDMGTTCVAIVGFSETEMRILPFVLSCRVFGYGIEHGVMNRLKQIARERAVKRIVARYQPTPHNSPCKDFLTNSGFHRSADVWSISTDDAPLPSPSWLAIEVK